ncbi:MAG: T9SS type A sorting domain-containing protein [Ignavibacteria bacterium]|nr:T9SS type A sorting domain-containing protein [Ignavibacteria bacterium]
MRQLFTVTYILTALILLPSNQIQAQASWPGEGTNTGISWVQYRNADGSLVRDVSGEPSIIAVQDICYDDAANAPASVLIASDGTNMFFRIMVGDKPTNTQGSIVNNVGYIVEIADASGTFQAAVALVKSSKDEIKVSNAAGTISNAIYSSPTAAIRAVQVVPGSATDAHWYVDFQTTIASITTAWSSFGGSTPTKYYFGTTAGASINTINKDWMGGNVSSVDWTSISQARPTSISTGTLYSSNISGSVTGAGTGVTLSYSDTTAKTSTINGSYNYTFAVSYNWSGTVTPSKTGYTFTPASRTYSNIVADQTSQNYTVDKVLVSGTITNGAGSTVTYTGGSVTANGSGYYEFWVTSGWTGTITPSLSGYTFSPASITISSAVTAPLGSQNFTALLSPIISGKVRMQSGGTGISGVTMSYTGTSSGSTSTNGTGDYSITVVSGSNETVTPSKTGYTFTSASLSYSNLTTHQTNQDYVIATILISGTTTIGGVTLSYTDGTAKQVTSDGSGNYSAWVSYNWSGSLTPTKTGYTFNPQSFSNVTAPATANFTPYVTISGNTGLSGTNVELVYNSTTLNTTSDGSGNYSFLVPYNTSSVVVTPTKIGYVFTPANRSASNITSATTIPTFSSVMPVELAAFSGSVKNNIVHLNWRTASEINNYGFTVERQVKGKSNWVTLGFVQGAGYSNQAIDYSFNDKQPLTGTLLYRLKQTDNDGTFSYSAIVEIKDAIIIPAYLQVAQNYPNPFNPSTTISFSIPETGTVRITIYNQSGEQVIELLNENLNAGAHSITWNATHQASGMYLCKIVTGKFTSVRKLLLVK